MRLLIVDDSKTMRSLLCSYAQDIQGETVEAADGLEALARLEEQVTPFDAALLDWDMPRMNGLELLKAIRTEPRYDGMKIMMVTANSTQDGVIEALSAGADDYLMKPLDGEMFADKLRLLGLVL
ncbi:Chemotaxis protein CheY [Lacunisphaera limnophila]|uniref:Chemotaxis protein CheY n=1 Tax=Lacunisphaera limnophila TaxID=1838286 RepID=A0A1D8AXJ6_9BACT|nr:response regulator [Lacunisphaera limnophila]AOS45615.1 Chemotaxis protein CheY [Lacunisphaera limnophila]